MELIIVRHGRPDHIEAGEAATEAVDPSLSAVGRAQADAVGRHLAVAGVDHVVSSPMARARETAAPLIGHLGLELEIVDGVAEYDREHTSYVPAEIRRARKDADWTDPLASLTDEERVTWIEGVVTAFRSVIGANAGRTVAVFCHGMVTSVWFAHVLGIDDLVRFTPDYCGVTRMLASGAIDHVTVRSFNETHFLGDHHIPLFER